MIARLAVGVALAAALTAAHIGAAHAQDTGDGAPRGPRFLVASAERRVPVDVTRTPALARRISLDLDGVTRKEALAEIARQAGLKLVYGDDMIGLEHRVQLQAQRITVAAALTDVLWDTELDVVLNANRQAALVRRPRGEPMPGTGSVTGKITDERTGTPLMGADVFLEGTKWRMATDTAGRYRLAEVDAGAYTLVARRIGYTKASRRLVVRDGVEDTLRITLTAAATPLDELVTTATGLQRRRDLGNTITTIRADSVLRTAPIRNLSDLLENRVPGLSAQRTSGAPGDPTRMRLRGLGSVFRSNDPVVIVDGVRVFADQSSARAGNLTNLISNMGSTGGIPAPSPLDQIDPNTIEKVDVFKGPSAATLYGADAANGVIVITTKKGRPGPTRWDVNVQYGRTDTPGRWPNGYYRFGRVPVLGGYPMFCPLMELRCVQDSLVRYQALNDPEMTILGRGTRGAASVTASGGSQSLTYAVTGSYSDETGLLTLPALEAERFQNRFNRAAPDWMQRPHHYKEWSVSSRVGAVLSAVADVALSTTISRAEQERTSLESKLGDLSGTYIDKTNGYYYTPGGTFTNSPGEFAYSLVPNTELIKEFYRQTTASSMSVTAGLSGTWRPKSWFNANASAGLNVMPRRDQFYLPAEFYSSSSDSGGAVSEGTGRSIVSTFDLRGNVRKPLRWGLVFETAMGVNLKTEATNDLVAAGSGLRAGTRSVTNAAVIHAVQTANESSVFGYYIEPRLVGQRLSLSTGVRLDGGSSYGARVSRTGSGGLGGLLLPKFNGSWVISEEPFFPFKSLFSSLQLRAAYGQAQNQPGPTDRLRLYRGSEQGRQLDLTTLGNTQLKPERSTEIEGGFAADMLDSRVSVELALYRKVQVDALMSMALPPSVNGGGTVNMNIGKIRNQGVELQVSMTPLRSSLMTWSASVNYTQNDNKLLELGRGVAPNPIQGLVEGYPIQSRWAKPIIGFADGNGNGIIERTEVQVGDSLVFLGRLDAAYRTSLFTNFELLGNAVGVTAGFSYDAGAMQIDQSAKDNWTLSRPLVDPSTPLLEQAAVIVLDATPFGLTQDVSTFRFTSLSIRYRVPSRIARALRAENVDIMVQGANLGINTTYRGKDPNVTAWTPGEGIIDTGQLPQPRTWQLALNLSY